MCHVKTRGSREIADDCSFFQGNNSVKILVTDGQTKKKLPHKSSPMLMYEEPVGCCSDKMLLVLDKMELPELYVNFKDRNLWFSLATIAFNPVFWNLVARWEYRTKSISRFVRKPKIGVILLALTIVSLGIFRDWRFKKMMDSQPLWPALYGNWILWSGYIAIVIGTTLVLTSYYALGFYGTFLGDYFGILMDKKVTGFPFTLLNDPMYVGSTLNFLGSAVVKASQTGILVSMLAGLGYAIALRFEGPFTDYIYREHEKLKAV